jgi:LPS-assembly lipoprotein
VKRAPVRPHVSFRFFSLLTIHLSLFLTGCGFHLRGVGQTELPPPLREMRVLVQGQVHGHGAQLTYDPLRVAVQDVLRNQAGVKIVDRGEVTTLVLMRERFQNQVLSVNPQGQAREFQIRYEVSFEVLGADNVRLTRRQTLYLQRDYLSEPNAILAREREEQELREALRQDAAQQILRRLAKANLEPQSGEE